MQRKDQCPILVRSSIITQVNVIAARSNDMQSPHDSFLRQASCSSIEDVLDALLCMLSRIYQLWKCYRHMQHESG